MTTNQQILTSTQSQWSERITAWESSQLTQSDFCKQQGLVYGTFVYWHSQLKKLNTSAMQPEPISFLPVTVKQDRQTALILRINDRHSVELYPGFDPVLLRQVVQAIHTSS